MNKEIEHLVKVVEETVKNNFEVPEHLRENLLNVELFTKMLEKTKTKQIGDIYAETTSIPQYEGNRFIEREGKIFLQYYNRNHGWKDVRLFEDE